MYEGGKLITWMEIEYWEMLQILSISVLRTELSFLHIFIVNDRYMRMKVEV